VRVIAITLLLGCAHDPPRAEIAPLPRILPQPDLMVPVVFESVDDRCEYEQLAGVPVSPECIIVGHVELQAILDNPACRVPLPAADGFYCTRGRVLMDADDPIVVAPGATATVHVTLVPGVNEDVLVDFDPDAKLEVESSTPESASPCLMWWTPPAPSPSRDRARVLLRPNAVVHAEIPWRAMWMDLDQRCNPIRRPLPSGHYTLAIPNPAYPLDLQHSDWEYGTPGAVRPLERIGEVRPVSAQ
jgi:hypothetical protein